MMKLIFVLLVPLVAAYGPGPDSRIVNGADQNIANFPWQGSYRSPSGGHYCGCIFIGGSNALTAAHCGGSSAFSMRFGSSDRTQGGTIVAVASLLQHPEYDNGPGFIPNDVTIVYATETISGPNVSPAALAPDAGSPGGAGWLTGWGNLCGGCGMPIVLQGVEMPIISDAECEQRWGASFQSDSMICVYNGQSGACNGDSGGPLAQGTTVYGITSWIATGCLSSYPSVYARIGAFTPWICANVDIC